MKPDVLVAYPLRSRQMVMLEETYTTHRLDLLTGGARDAMLEEVGPRCSAMVVNGHVAIDDAFLARLPSLKIAACSSAGFDQMDVAAMTRRGVTRVHRLAWTVADLAGIDQPGVAEARTALRLRSGDPLLAATLQRRAG